MSEGNDFNQCISPDEITKLIAGKTVLALVAFDDRMDDFLAIQFTDGTELVIRYDYIYSWRLAARP